jgi:hypothetical protein
MLVRFQRIDDRSHRLTVVRTDRSSIERTLETHSVLLHDLVHLAVEAEAGIDDGFWGLLASGVDFEELLAEASHPTRAGIRLAESLVGPMQAVWKGHLTADGYVAMARDAAPFVDSAFVDRVLERLRRLWGHWNGTPFHEAMEVTWPIVDRA